jgi:hypothetical protein
MYGAKGTGVVVPGRGTHTHMGSATGHARESVVGVHARRAGHRGADQCFH